MSNENKYIVDEKIRKRIAEIEEIEKQQLYLKRQREILLREKPWYKRPTSIISIIAILVSITLFILNTYISHQNKELTITYTNPSSLVLFTGSIKSKARIVYEQKKISDMSRSVIAIKNTGTKAIQLDDFKDGPIVFRIIYSNNENYEKTDTGSVPPLLDIVNKNGAGQKLSVLQISSRMKPSVFTYLPSLLNPGEVVELEIYTSTQSEFSITAEGKISDGNIVFQGRIEAGSTHPTPSNYKDMFLVGLNGLLGAKWITILISMILFIISLFLSIIFWSELIEPSDFIEYVIASFTFIVPGVFLFVTILVFLT